MSKYRVRRLQKLRKRILAPLLKSKFFWFFILFLIILGGISYFFLFSDYLKIKNIEITGNKKINSDDIKNIVNQELSSKIFNIIPKNIFLANLKSINDNVLEKFPLAYKADVKRKLFNSLAINIEERSPVALWCKNDDCFDIDKEGIVFEKGESKGLVIKSDEDINMGQNIIEKDYLGNIIKIYKESKLDIKEISVSNSEKIIIRTTGDWEVYFRGDDTIPDQIDNLKLVLEQKIPSENRGDLEHIDLRFGSKVYFRYKNSAPQNLIDSENKN